MRRIAALASVTVLVLVLLGIAQVVLPGIAANRIRRQLDGSGRVLSVSVSAFPAIELLWHQADSVDVKMASYHSGTSHLSSLLDESSDVGTLTASAGVLTDGLLTIHDATLHKHGNTLTGSALVLESDLRAAVPVLQSVTPVASPSGQLVLEGSVSVFGFSGSAAMSVTANNGRIVATPDLPLLGSVLSFQLFSDPHLAVGSVSARPATGGFTVAASGALR
jgi:hypothetical protein